MHPLALCGGIHGDRLPGVQDLGLPGVYLAVLVELLALWLKLA
jgi:hypothetical protein